MLESESSSDARVSSGGYSAAVQGASHQLRRQNEALVRLPRDASYKLVFTNAYDSVCAVNVEIDGIQVGERCLKPIKMYIDYIFFSKIKTINRGMFFGCILVNSNFISTRLLSYLVP